MLNFGGVDGLVQPPEILARGSWKVWVFLATFTWQHLGLFENDEGKAYTPGK